jgi:heme exporter protein D
MHWNSFEEFLAMGGYAFFVWSSVGVTALTLVIEILILQSHRKQLKSTSQPLHTTLESYETQK